MTRKKLVLFMAPLWALASMLLISACGGDDPTPTPIPPTNTPVPVAEEPAEPSGPVPLDLGASGWQNDDRVQALYERAKAEGAVMLYNQHDEVDAAYCEGYKEMFPGIDCDYKVIPFGTTSTVYLTERTSGRHIADLMIDSRGGLSDLVKRESFSDEIHFANDFGVDPSRVEIDGKWMTMKRQVFTHFYNQDLVDPSDLPQTLEDFLDPKWKSKIATLQFAYFPSFGYQTVGMGVEGAKAWSRDFHTRFMGEMDPLVVYAEKHLINSGERLISYQSYGGCVFERELQGDPCGYFMTDGMGVLDIIVGVMGDAPHPNAGALFALYIASVDGSEDIYNTPGSSYGQGWPGYGHSKITELLDPNFGGYEFMVQTEDNYEEINNFNNDFIAWSRTQ